MYNVWGSLWEQFQHRRTVPLIDQLQPDKWGVDDKWESFAKIKITKTTGFQLEFCLIRVRCHFDGADQIFSKSFLHLPCELYVVYNNTMLNPTFHILSYPICFVQAFHFFQTFRSLLSSSKIPSAFSVSHGEALFPSSHQPRLTSAIEVDIRTEAGRSTQTRKHRHIPVTNRRHRLEFEC